MDMRRIVPFPTGALLALAMGAPAPAQPAPVFEDVPCEAPASQDAADRAEALALVRCGRVAAPRLYEDPAAGDYSLRVAVLKAGLAPVEPDPVLVLLGGPGASAVEAALASAGRVPPIDRDTVFIDPRGVGGSEPRVCLEGAMSAWRDLYAADLTTEEMAQASDAILERCFAEARADGHAAESFGSKVDADDIERVRQALGVESWNVLGSSYGGVLALTLAGRHPGSIRSLVLDSPSLGALTPMDRREGWAAARAAFLAACAADAACSAEHPDLGGEIDRALARLEAEPLRVAGPEGEMTLNRGDLELLLFGMLYTRDSAAAAPALIRAAAEGRGGHEVIQSLTFAASVMAQLSQLSWGATMCRDNPPGSKLGRTPGPPVGYEALLPGPVCAAWGAPDPAPAPLPEGVAIPTLVLSGALDPVTPSAVGRYAASLAGPAARHVEVPGQGHGVLGSTPCTLEIWTAFLADPSAPLDTSCIAEAPPLAFASPTSGSED